MKNQKLSAWVVLIALNLMNFSQMVEAATITLAESPLANMSTDVVRPNIMYVLDNSGSMAWDYLPDYVSSGSGGTGSQICWNGNSDSNTRSTCSGVGGEGSDVTVPFATSAINYVYYNPATYYRPPIKADKTSYANSSVTAASIDGFDSSPASTMNFKTATTVTSSLNCTPVSGSAIVTCGAGTEGLTGTFVTLGTGVPSGAYVTATPTATTLTLSAAATSNTASSWTFKTGGYEHQAFCTTGSPTEQNLRGNGAVCRETLDTTTPSNLFPNSTFNDPETYDGPAYYYTMGPMEYCTDSFFTNCVPNTADATHAVPALYRWCQTYNPGSPPSYSNCQDLRNATHTIPDYLGGIQPTVPAVQASANLVINSYIPGKSITGLTVGGTNVIGASTFTAGVGGLTSAHLVAVAVCAAIRSNTVFSGYNCPTDPPASGALSATVTIKANIPPAFASYGGSPPNGNAVVVTGNPTVSTGAYATGIITITSTTGATKVDDITVGPTSLLAATAKPYYFANGTQVNTIATALCTLIESNKGASGYGCPSTSGATLNIQATGFGINTSLITFTATGIAAKATITANSAVAAAGGHISAISVSSTTLDNAQSFAANATTTTVATQIKNNLLGASGFSATAATNVVTFTAPTGNAYNGQAITIAAGGIAATSATGTLTISTGGAIRVDDIKVGATSVLAAASKPYYFGDTDTTATICAKLATLITANSFTATCGGSTLTITAPAGTASNGAAITMTGTAVSAKGTLTSTAAVGAAIGSTGIISSNGTTIQAAQNFAASSSTSAVATQIRGAVFQNSFTNGGGTGAAVIIVAPAGNDFNNKAIAVNAGTTSGGTASSGNITITDGNTTTCVGANKRITALTCGGTATINTSTVSAGSTCTGGTGSIANLTTGLTNNDINGYTISGCTAPSGSPQSATCNIVGPIGGPACALSAALDSSPGFSVSGSLTAGSAATTSYISFSQVPFATAGSGGSATATPNAGYDAASGTGTMNSSGTAAVPNYAGSLSGGTFPNATNGTSGSATATANAGYAAQTATGSGGALAGGNPSSGPIDTTATAPATLALAGGMDALGGRVGVGKFTRVDIVPNVNSYTKAGTRTDCAGATCTYAEELQNFANWYSYYRTRLLMAKTTSTLAFDPLDSKYRVGFDLLSHYPNNSIDLEVAQFVDTGGETVNQRTSWWDKLTQTSTSGSTPLRSSLMKMGKYYGGKLTNGVTIPAVSAVKASGSIQVNSTTSNGAIVSGITIEGISMMSSALPAVSGCTGTGGSCTSTQRQTIATNLFNLIIGSAAYTSQTTYTATRSGSTITFTANTAGNAHNGDDIQVTKTGTINLGVSDLTGGVNSAAAVPPAVIEPIQYSCQQNYTLLVTDGYWNTDSYNDLKQLNGTTKIGNQDNVNSGLTARPSYDGALASTTCDDSTFSSCGTLADVAMYYYKTDLRDASLGNAISGATNLDVSANNVFQSPTDANQQQHMVLFTMALGIPGTLRYAENYLSGGSDDYNNIINGLANWPAPKANDPTGVDDVWHAAVNGRGKYFSARDPGSVVTGLNEALASVQIREGSAAAAATSNLEPVAGDNFAYVATYTTVEWAGDLQARYIDLTTGAVQEPANASPNECISDSGCAWSAKHKLDNADWAARKVYIAPTGGATGAALRAFNYGNLTGSEQAYFNPSTLNQYGSVFALHPTEITATKMVDFLRGDTSLEVGNASSNPEVWRKRAHILGDIVSTQPIFASEPRSSYQDTGYAAFVTAQAGREGAVYVSSNDGMLHAFASDDFADASASGGDELWAYIPTQQMPYLKDLADTNYTHHYYLDGQITVADVNFGGGSSDWHTILVGGMGGGGTAYYALDITDPVNPKYLWEFTAANLGYTYGNATINKLPNGEWAVMFSSGYNNANGKGYLYAVNPQTGAIKTGFPITTGSGTAGSPSNLGKITAWVDNSRIDNTATHIYGGDMEGDLWRFDLTTKTAFKLAHLQDAEAIPNAQPITTKPEMTLIEGTRVIYVGTGRYIAVADLPDTKVQSFYGIKDTLGGDNITAGGGQVTWHPRDDTITPIGKLFIQRKLFSTTDSGAPITTLDALGNTVTARKICTGAGSSVDNSTGNCVGEPTSPTEMDWETYGGWYFDFADPGERMNVDMNLTFGTLSIPSNVPASSACTTGGFGYMNFIDFKTGLSIVGEDVVSLQISNSLIVGINVLYVNGKLVVDAITSAGGGLNIKAPGDKNKFLGVRDLWRELNPY